MVVALAVIFFFTQAVHRICVHYALSTLNVHIICTICTHCTQSLQLMNVRLYVECTLYTDVCGVYTDICGVYTDVCRVYTDVCRLYTDGFKLYTLCKDD